MVTHRGEVDEEVWVDYDAEELELLLHDQSGDILYLIIIDNCRESVRSQLIFKTYCFL